MTLKIFIIFYSPKIVFIGDLQNFCCIIRDRCSILNLEQLGITNPELSRNFFFLAIKNRKLYLFLTKRFLLFNVIKIFIFNFIDYKRLCSKTVYIKISFFAVLLLQFFSECWLKNRLKSKNTPVKHK